MKKVYKKPVSQSINLELQSGVLLTFSTDTSAKGGYTVDGEEVGGDASSRKKWGSLW